MGPAIVDLITIGFVVLIFAFLWWIARAMRSHLGKAEPRTATHHIEVRGEGGVALSIAPLDRPVVIGRSPQADLVIDDPFASDFHARVGPAEGGYRVHDLGSTNGTFLNGQRLAAPASVGPGDTIQIGQTIMGIR